MVHITVVLGLQGRARRNAKIAMHRLQRARDEAREAAVACAEQAQAAAAAAPADRATVDVLDPRAPEWAALAERFQDPDVDQRALLLELMRRLRSLDLPEGDERSAQAAPGSLLERS